MNEIKVNDYIRTKKGQIDRLQYKIETSWRSKDNEGNIIARCEKNRYWLEDIENYSKDIIDLITMEDIFKIKEGDTIVYIGFTNNYAEEYADFIEQVKNKEIELLEVLTKEQFLRNSYKIGE